MYKRTKCEIYLTKEEQQLLIDFFKYCKSFSRTSQLANFFLWRKGSEKRIDYRVIARWLRRVDSVMVEITLRQRQQERIKWRQEGKKQRQLEYNLRDLIIVGGRRK